MIRVVRFHLNDPNNSSRGAISFEFFQTNAQIVRDGLTECD
jgi:hypothetical protein